jgi:hypothetical protein
VLLTTVGGSLSKLPPFAPRHVGGFRQIFPFSDQTAVLAAAMPDKVRYWASDTGEQC